MTGESERIRAIRNGTRKTERRAKRLAAIIRRAITVLDDLADELETALTEREPKP